MKLIGGEAIHSPEFHKKKRKEKLIKRTIIALALIILVVVPIIVSRYEKLLIKNIEIKGNSVTRDEDIQKIVADKLSGNYLWLFPKSNSLIYPRQSLRETLQNRIPRLRSVTLDLTNLQTLAIGVEEREPYAMYCKNISNLANPADCYFLDDSGFIFSEAPFFSGEVYFIYAKPTPIDEPIGKEYMPAERFRPFPLFIKDLSLIGVHARAMEDKGEEYSLILPNGGRIIWRASEDVGIVFSNLEAFLKDDSIASQRDFLDRILYIDLKFPNKVFYKFQ